MYFVLAFHFQSEFAKLDLRVIGYLLTVLYAEYDQLFVWEAALALCGMKWLQITKKLKLHFVLWDVSSFSVFALCARCSIIPFCSKDHPLCNLPNGANLFVLVPSWINPLYFPDSPDCSFPLGCLAAHVPGCGAHRQSFALFQSAAPPPPYAAFIQTRSSHLTCLIVRPLAVYTMIKQSDRAKWRWQKQLLVFVGCKMWVILRTAIAKSTSC